MIRLAHGCRWLLTLAAGLVVAWSFAHVTAREARQWYADRTDIRTPITILHWGDVSEAKIVADLVTAFEAQKGDIRVNRIHVGIGNFPAKLNTLFAADRPPDLFYLSASSLPKMASKDLLEPLPLDTWLASDSHSGRLRQHGLSYLVDTGAAMGLKA